MQDWRGLSSYRRDTLELLDGVWGPQDSALALSCDGSCTLVVTGSEQLVEPLSEELVGSGQAEAPSKSEGNLLTVRQLNQLVHHVVDDVWLTDGGRHDHAPLVHENAATRGCTGGRDEDRVLRHLRADQHGAGGDIEHEEIASLCDHENHAVLLTQVQPHRKVRWSIGWHGDIDRNLVGGSTLTPVFGDVHDVQLGLPGSSLPLLEGEEACRHLSVAHQDVAEAARVTLQQLLLLPLDAVELHVAVDGLSLVLGGDARQQAPRDLAVGAVADNLGPGLCELARALEHLLRHTVCHLEVPVVDVLGADQGEDASADPAPEHDGVRRLPDAELLLGVQIEDLHEVTCLSLGDALQCDDVIDGVHQRCLCLHRSPVHRVAIVHVHHYHLSRAISSGVLDADVFVGLHGQVSKPEGLGIDALVCEADAGVQRDWQCSRHGVYRAASSSYQGGAGSASTQPIGGRDLSS
mmetsp:Transcript_30631/g.49134  ORF Transcript_30631/g.49134 Transcript_30631/m.49134 type:complete len:464 (+) Transcript_30631:3166-4557(+)